MALLIIISFFYFNLFSFFYVDLRARIFSLLYLLNPQSCPTPRPRCLLLCMYVIISDARFRHIKGLTHAYFTTLFYTRFSL